MLCWGWTCPSTGTWLHAGFVPNKMKPRISNNLTSFPGSTTTSSAATSLSILSKVAPRSCSLALHLAFTIPPASAQRLLGYTPLVDRETALQVTPESRSVFTTFVRNLQPSHASAQRTLKWLMAVDLKPTPAPSARKTD